MPQAIAMPQLLSRSQTATSQPENRATMKLAEQHIIKRGHSFWHQIDKLSRHAKNLYNAANYLIRQNFIYGQG